jgi:hypothetical protein
MPRKRSTPLGSPSARHVARFEKGVDALERMLNRASSAALTGDCRKAHWSLMAAAELSGRVHAEKTGSGNSELSIPVRADARGRFDKFCGFRVKRGGGKVIRSKTKKGK